MKRLSSVLAFLFLLLSASAQQRDKLEKMWQDILSVEKEALMMESGGKQLLNTVRSRSTTPEAIPYPQMKILLDSIHVEVDAIQQIRRTFAGDRDKILAACDKKGKIKKGSNELSLFNELEKATASRNAELEASSDRATTWTEQFSNLVMLHQIRITTYSVFYEEFLKKMEEAENRMMACSSALGQRRAALAALEKGGEASEEELGSLRSRITELEQIVRYIESKITQVHNFQDRISTTQGDEEIIYGPGVSLPYELQMLESETKVLNNYFESFELLNADS